MKMRRFFISFVFSLFCLNSFSAPAVPDSIVSQELGNLMNTVGVEMFEEEIDNVIFQTNQFLTDATFIGANGPFWWILEMCMALGAMFSIIMAAGMTYKMMVTGEPFDVLKILRVLAIAIVMFWWYPHGGNGASVLGTLAYIPNCIGSYTHDLYAIEAAQVQQKFDELKPLIIKRDTMMVSSQGTIKSVNNGTQSTLQGSGEMLDPQSVTEANKLGSQAEVSSTYSGILVFIDKIVLIGALLMFRIGWWATIYCQQILLGMLTIFGPIMWAFSILPKWEGSWAKWITRYLTVHFYGAMLYFVGFYVLLLFDIVLSVQIENLQAITQSGDSFQGYLHNTFITAGYLLVASIVSLKCLNLVPDLAAWMIPEGDTAFSTRNFGEGVATQAKASATSILR